MHFFLLSIALAFPDLAWHTVDGGGGRSVGGSFELSGTSGQADAGSAVGATFELTGGFWSGTVVPGPACPADLDGSGDVGFSDLLDVLGHWGACAPACPQDLDGSGDVGFGDLLEVLASWGDCG